MDTTAVHTMKTELITERQTMRYTCPVCQRCMEDRPEGLVLLNKGDQHARHVAGVFSTIEMEIEQAPPVKPVLH